MNEARHRAIISGAAKGIAPALLRAGFMLAALAFSCAARLRLFAYRCGLLRRKRASIPVICVGNLSVGGTGKTPMVIALSHALMSQNHRVAIVSRGYRALADGSNDEARLIAEELPEAIQVANPDRHAGVGAAAEAGAEIAILDDGFSHLKLQRDLDILLFDASQPKALRRMLPRGLLREPLQSARRAGFAVVTRASGLSDSEKLAFTKQLASFDLGSDRVAFAEHRPSKLVGVSAEGLFPPLESLRGKRVVALCGIANPTAFQRTLEGLGLDVLHLEALADHFDYSDAWLQREMPRLCALNADAIVVTQKDAVKLRGRLDDLATPVFELRIEMALEGDGLERLMTRVNQAMAARQE